MSVYTKCGDCGKSSVINDNDIPKYDIIFDVLGTADELGAFLGLARSEQMEQSEMLECIQTELVYASACLAGGNAFDWAAHTKNFEEFIDVLDAPGVCPTTIIISGKSRYGALLDVCRTVCRRLERCVVRAAEQNKCPAETVAYYNRLSDLLFIMARRYEAD